MMVSNAKVQEIATLDVAPKIYVHQQNAQLQTAYIRLSTQQFLVKFKSQARKQQPKKPAILRQQMKFPPSKQHFFQLLPAPKSPNQILLQAVKKRMQRWPLLK